MGIMETMAEKLIVYREIGDRTSRHPGVMSLLRLADDLAKVPPVFTFRAIVEEWNFNRIAKEVYAELAHQRGFQWTILEPKELRGVKCALNYDPPSLPPQGFNVGPT